MASVRTWGVADAAVPVPPVSRPAESTLYHGVRVADPYRWLEDGDADRTREWVAQQNQRTRDALDARKTGGRSIREQWHERLVELIGLPVVLQVKVRGDRLFVVERGAGEEQFSLVLRSAHDAAVAPRRLIDPGAESVDAATAIDWFFPSADGRLVAYGLSEGGTENSTLAILDVDTGHHLSDRIAETRASTVAWLADSSGFYYAAYPEGDQYNRRVKLHLLGTSVADDPVVWSDPDAPQSWPDVELSLDGRFLLVEVLVGWGRNDAFVLDREDGTWHTVVAGVEATASFDFMGDELVITTTIDAPRGRIVLAPLVAPSLDNWRTVVPECDGVIDCAYAFGAEILAVVTERAVDRIERWSPPAASAFDAVGPDTDRAVSSGDIAGPCSWTGERFAEFGIVSITAVAIEKTTLTAFVVVTGFDAPPTLFACAAITGPRQVAPDIDASQPASVPMLTVEHTFYRSIDGTDIGMFLIHRDDVVPGPDTPTILNGYGGFAISETPNWSPTIAAWCAAGGLYAIAGLRGGLEEGESWHHAGRRANKQNVFDDFHAGADWLVATGRTTRDRLAIAGGSNGGLLVGVALTQRPDLCAAVWCAVPLLDMIRFPNFLIARLWTDEYGDPDVEEEFH
ncbi:MAG: prolyl oligopeptidase family serine peptidase, partial [Ilumatobacteraceae bacterium]